MIAKTLAAFATIAFLSSAFAGINFTALEVEQSLEGIKFKQLLFNQDGAKIAYQPPRDWRYAADGARIRMTPPTGSQAFAQIEQAPLPTPEIFDDETCKALQQKTLAAVPPGSQQVMMVAEERNPLVVANHETYEVTVSYEAYGQRFMTSVLYLDLPDTQLRFRATARKDDFEAVHKAFRASIFSWQWK